MTDLSTPHLVMARLEEIEEDLAIRQNALESAASAWFKVQHEQKKAYAMTLLSSTKDSVTEKKAAADLAAHAVEGSEHEPEYLAIKAVLGMLETRATICMSVLKSQGRS
jgi:hypothetical protein